MSEIQQQVSMLSPDSLVLLTIFGRDKNGVFYEYDQFTPLIAESSAVPVYGTWDFSLGYGIVGGKLTSGYTEGERGAKLAIRILNGEDPADIPVEKQTQSQHMFDYKMLERWGIDSADLPEGSVVLGKPTSFYEENTTLVWGIAIGFALLLFAIVFLVINNNQRRIAQKRLAQSNQELQVLQVSLEQRVDERTKALTTVSEIGTAASTILEIDKLLQEVVNVSKERFGLYHAHIYLLDESEENLVLSSGAGEPGRQMVAQGRSIPLAQEKSLVARAARERQGVTVNDVTQEPDFLPNPLLPDTRSELAVPMMVGEKVIGVFDVQSDVVGRFTEADIAVQIALASQIASAVQNARLFEQTQTALLQSEEAQQLTSDVIDSTDDWIFIKDQDHRYRLVNQGYAKSLHIPKADFIGKNDLDLGFPEELVKGNPEKGINGFWADDRAVMNSGVSRNIPDDIVTIDGEIRVLDTVKIPLRNADNNVWGVLAFSRDMTERRNLEALTRRRAEQEESLSRITQKIQGTTTMAEALQVVARELGHALGNKSTLVMLEPDAMPDKSSTFQGATDPVPNPETT
jgi:putative methionine-R-sulfoxide reductase with GAF domain